MYLGDLPDMYTQAEGLLAQERGYTYQANHEGM